MCGGRGVPGGGAACVDRQIGLSTGEARQQGDNRGTDKKRGGAWGCVCVGERERSGESVCGQIGR